jgi:hypothetical protein
MTMDFQRQHQRRDITIPNLGRRVIWHPPELGEGVQTEALSGGLAAGSAGALGGGGFGDGVDLEGFDAELGIEFAAFGEACVDYEADSGDGDGGLGDVCCEDYFTGVAGWGGEGFVLEMWGEGREEWAYH